MQEVSTTTPGVLNQSRPSASQNNLVAATLESASYRAAALLWFKFGFSVIPIKRKLKVPDVSWNSWLRELSAPQISAYWKRYADREVGFIVGDQTIVFDADSPKATAALYAIEQKFGVSSALIVRTTKGEHHYFRRAAGTRAASDAHSTKLHPERIDVKTGRALILLPPSTGKTIMRCDADCAFSLSEASQEFADAVALHNGRIPTREVKTEPAPRAGQQPDSKVLALLAELLRDVPANNGYADWLQVLMIIYNEMGGGATGFELADSWSSKGTDYKGSHEIAAKWRSFRHTRERQLRIGTLFMMAKRAGMSPGIIRGRVEEPFEPCDTEVVHSGAKSLDGDAQDPTD